MNEGVRVLIPICTQKLRGGGEGNLNLILRFEIGIVWFGCIGKHFSDFPSLKHFGGANDGSFTYNVKMSCRLSS